jgi:hypothetical protein
LHQAAICTPGAGGFGFLLSSELLVGVLAWSLMIALVGLWRVLMRRGRSGGVFPCGIGMSGDLCIQLVVLPLVAPIFGVALERYRAE